MATQDTFPFLNLPAEIRNEVYYLTLCERHDPADPYRPSNCTALAPPAITRTNRQLRQETISFYYSHNRFVIHFPLFQYPSDSGSGGGDNDNGVQHHNRPASLTSSSFEHWCAAIRIGDDALDVHDPIAVQGACFVAMREQTNLRFWGVVRQQPFLNAIRALSTVAPLCTQINSRMYFSWDVPYDPNFQPPHFALM
ncbi:1-3-beta-glucanosyltransferase-like protein [Apiospora arundinis]